MPLDRRAIAAFLGTLDGLDTLSAPHAEFYYYDPRKDIPHDKRQPFATIIDADDFDGAASDLARRGLYRVNAGVTRDSYRAVFGPEPDWNREGPVATGHDFTLVDKVLPHPVYAPMSWICIVSPTEASWPRLQTYLTEAHAKAKHAHDRRSVA